LTASYKAAVSVLNNLQAAAPPRESSFESDQVMLLCGGGPAPLLLRLFADIEVLKRVVELLQLIGVIGERVASAIRWLAGHD